LGLGRNGLLVIQIVTFYLHQRKVNERFAPEQ